MTMQPFSLQPSHMDEPAAAQEYSNVLTRVASEHQPIILRRHGQDLAAVIPLEHLEVLQDALARQEADRVAKEIDWDTVVKTYRPPQEWFDNDEPKPF